LTVLKSLEELGEAMGTKKFSHSELVTVEPIYMKQLVEKYGAKKIAATLGLGSSTISKAIATNKIRLVFEIAAKTIWSEREGSSTMPKLFISEVPKAKEEMLRGFLTATGIKFSVLR